ncbi:MAG: DUF1540 domain-containing protein [Oscillospiraceae bacterium]|nr:DUF1540 domain-containing protein [Oscillospiraceae bacterium]
MEEEKDEKEEKQTINCTVESCIHHDNENEKCELGQITVEPSTNADSGDPEDESMCGDYEEENPEDNMVEDQ